MEAHGGPTGQFTETYPPMVQMLLSEGWAVLRPNMRGNTGYGMAFEAAERNDLGDGDLRDLLAGVDAVLVRAPADPRRIAMIGMSHGGELVAFAVARTRRFRAIAAAAPVTDEFSEYETEKVDGAFYDRWFIESRWRRFDDARRQSPVASAPGATMPLPLLQGKDDKTNPLSQSVEMWNALREVGAPGAAGHVPTRRSR